MRRVFAERSNIYMPSAQKASVTAKPATNAGRDANTNTNAPIPPVAACHPVTADSSAQMLSVPFYFTSPLTTLLESLHDPDCTQVSLHDIMEAYDCFSDRIRSVADSLFGAQGTPRALGIIEERSSELAQILKRDLQRPFSSPPLHSQYTLDLYPYDGTSTTFSDDDAQYALDSSQLAQHALCLISDICTFRPLYSLFSGAFLKL